MLSRCETKGFMIQKCNPDTDKGQTLPLQKGKWEIQECGVSAVSVNHCCGCGRRKPWNRFLKQDSLVFLIVRESKVGVRF